MCTVYAPIYAHNPMQASGMQMAGSPLISASPHDLFMTISAAFSQYTEVSDKCALDNEAAKAKLSAIDEACHSRGLFGLNFLQALRMFQPQIAWERMVPDEFARFYRFAFHLCKQPNRKHIQTEVAVEAWRLLLTLRFRLLDKWCDFVLRQRATLQVINEDQWRQVLDFSRVVHEDLSNYDPNGAWACCLDDFVEHMRSQRPQSRSHILDEDVGTSMDAQDMETVSGLGVPVSPRPGSKRRSPDVDTVAERLSAFPLPSTASEDLSASPRTHTHITNNYNMSSMGQPALQHAQVGSATKRHCPSPAFGTRGPAPMHPHAGAHHSMQPGGAGMAGAGVGSILGGSWLTGGGGGMGGVSGGGLVMQQAGVQTLQPMQGMQQGGGEGVAGCQDPLQPFACELPMLSLTARRHIKPRRSNVSELVNSTVSGALFLSNE